MSEHGAPVTNKAGTSTPLTDTLAGLEGTLARSVETATGDISDTARNVGDSVGQVARDITGAAGNLSHAVSAAVSDAAHSFGDLLDVTGHVRRHPWAGLGVSVFVGFLLGGVLRS
jgi:ElaB/YqjD/DUF883 family membrane-anchored ribosome-binding protein